MWPKIGNSRISMRKVIITSILQDLTRKTSFLEGWSWFKFNNLGLALGIDLAFYTSVAKGLKLKVKRFLGIIPTFVEVTKENLVGKSFCPPSFWIGLKFLECKFFSFTTLNPSGRTTTMDKLFKAALVFMWNTTLRENFNFFFSAAIRFIQPLTLLYGPRPPALMFWSH